MIRTVNVTRYVTPLREGGSLPAIVEADDDGLYVLKFRGAGQGPLALIAELVAGEIGRLLGVDLVIVEASNPAQFETAFEAARRQGAGAIHVLGDPRCLRNDLL